jgi:hypothetical protein
MQILVLLGIILFVVLGVLISRRRRDRTELRHRIQTLGGELVRMRRVKRAAPFPDVTRGWWAWRIEWRDRRGQRLSWALTTRDGVKEWRDDDVQSDGRSPHTD